MCALRYSLMLPETLGIVDVCYRLMRQFTTKAKFMVLIVNDRSCLSPILDH